jgi:purine-nucleoside phosphorylase
MGFDKITEAAEYIRSRCKFEPKIALVLGSGLGAFADTLEDATVISYDEIPHFAKSTVEGHAGKLVIGKVCGVPVIVQQGRFHYYEGYDMEQVMLPVRAFSMIGVETLILTNAAGSIRTSVSPGTLMLIRDHINLMGENPLRGPNDNRIGPRFPDMTAVYDRDLQTMVYGLAQEMAAERGDDSERFLWRGVYCALSGPTYETPSEIRMLRILGADAVGMSTVPEAIAARHRGMRVLGISCISNVAAGMTDAPINHEEVMEMGLKVSGLFQELLQKTITKIGAEQG